MAGIEHDGCYGCKYFGENDVEMDSKCYDCKLAHKSERLVDNYTPMTNADKIRNMTDEELAEYLNKVLCREVDIIGECKDSKCVKKYCTECTCKWLQKEVEE